MVIPSSPARAYGLLLAAIRDPDPVVFLEPTRLYRLAKEAVADDGEALPLDVCFVLREGSDVTLVTWGAMLRETLAAADALADEGISAEVIDVATLKPLDIDTILDSVAQDRPLRDRARGGAQRRLRRRDRRARSAERGLLTLLAPVERVTGYDTIMPLPRLEQALPARRRIASPRRRSELLEAA